MIHPPLRLYGEGLASNRELVLRLSDGSATPVVLSRWLGPPDATDELLLSDAAGPVLDVGCGPGRHLHALARRGVFALGVDLSPIAVALARHRGAMAVVGSIFDDVPGAGKWRTALLLDGNIGIGGDPVRLLTRIRALLTVDGEILLELDDPNATTASISARLEGNGDTSAWFKWARVACHDVGAVAHAAGFAVGDCWQTDGRWFARLQMP